MATAVLIVFLTMMITLLVAMVGGIGYAVVRTYRGSSVSGRQVLRRFGGTLAGLCACVAAGEVIGLATHVGGSDDASALAGVSFAIIPGLVVLVLGSRWAGKADRREP